MLDIVCQGSQSYMCACKILHLLFTMKASYSGSAFIDETLMQLTFAMFFVMQL